MAGTLRNSEHHMSNKSELLLDDNTTLPAVQTLSDDSDIDSPTSDIEIYSQEVLNGLIADNLPPTPNNFSLYFDRLLEEKNENLKKQIFSLLELEESNDAETTIALEHSLKKGFASIKNILLTTANLYKNMTLMTKILDKRKKELVDNSSIQAALNVASALDNDIGKLNSIVKKQSIQMKSMYDETAAIVKNVENETIFDNQFGVYNKRYLMGKLEQEIGLVKQFKHQSSLIMIELSRDLKASIVNEKALVLMTRTIARLLLKTSRRSDIVAHYGNGVFTMLLKHTDIQSAEKASERLCYLVSNSNFFLADREIQLKVSIGITKIDVDYSMEEIIVAAINGADKAYKADDIDYVVEYLYD